MTPGVAPMILPRDINRWPREWLVEFQEREAIMLDSNVPDARRLAEEDIRKRAKEFAA